jgi:hypothetical protein
MKKLELRIEKEEFRTVKCEYQFFIPNSKFLICCISLLLCSNAMADSLKFRFSPGDKYLLVSVIEQKMSRVIDGNTHSSEQTTRLECDFDVEEVDEKGFAWAKYSYKRVTMKARSEEQKFDFDSDANQVKMPLLVMPLRMAVGESIYLRITPLGRIEKINGLQGVITYAKAKMNSFSGGGLDVVSQNIDRRFAEPAVRRELESQLAVFPDSNNERAIWTRKDVLSSADMSFAKAEQIDEVNVVFEKTFRLNLGKSGGNDMALVDVNLTIKPDSTPVSNMSASDSKTGTIREISGEGTGLIEIERTTGRIISNIIIQDTIERIKFAAPSQMLRPPPSPEPVISHTVTTFQMTKIAEGKPAQPADANEKSPSSGPFKAN